MRLLRYALALTLASAASAAAQTPAAPAQTWTGSLAAGLALTGGNTSTTTTNLAFVIESDKARKNVVRAEGLNLRSSRDGNSIVDRTLITAENAYAVTTRSFVFGRFQYLRDVFKRIDYLVSPTVGVGYKVIESERSLLMGDVAVGAVAEKNPATTRSSSGAVTASERASHKLSDTAVLTQSLTGLWKMSDFGDALINFQAGLAANVTSRTQVKIDFLSSYKSQTPSPLVKNNDLAVVTAVVFKF